MTPKEVKKYYGNQYKFHKETGMSVSTLGNWLKWGYVPLLSQVKLEQLTDGKLKVQWSNDKNDGTGAPRT